MEVTQILIRYKVLLDSLELIKYTLAAIGQKAVKHALTQYLKMAGGSGLRDRQQLRQTVGQAGNTSKENRMQYASHKRAEASCVILSVVETYRM